VYLELSQKGNARELGAVEGCGRGGNGTVQLDVTRHLLTHSHQDIYINDKQYAESIPK
jgi:hypothetical protein